MSRDVTDRAPPRPRLTGRVLLPVAGLGMAYSISVVDPLLLSLNLSTVGQHLHVPPGQLGFLGSAATLVVAAVVLAVGNLGDQAGLKRLLISGLVLNMVAELLAALAPSYPFLLAMRFLDGLALTALLGLSLALLKLSVPEEAQSMAIGIFLAIDAVLFGVTPVLGGLVVQALGWRALFAVVVPLGLVALVLIARYTVQPARQPRHRFDVLGVFLFGVSLLALVYGVSAIQNGFTPQTWVPLALGGCALAAFVYHERRVRQPALDLSLFGSVPFVLAVVALLTLNLFAAGLGVVLGQFGRFVLSLSAAQIGLIYLPGTLVIAGSSVFAGRLVARYTARPVLIGGMLVLVASGVLMATTLSAVMAIWLLVLATWLGNLGSFLATTPASDTVLSHAPTEKAGSVTAVQPTFATLGNALGPTVYILLVSVFFRHEWLADASSRALSASQAQHAVDVVTSSMANTPGVTAHDPNLVAQSLGLVLDVDYTNAVQATMAVVSLAPLAVALLVFLLLPRPTGRHRRAG